MAGLQSGLAPQGLASMQTQARRPGVPSVALQEPPEYVGRAVGHLGSEPVLGPRHSWQRGPWVCALPCHENKNRSH